MRDTVKTMLESDFGFGVDTFSKNRQLFDNMNIVSENVRQLTGYIPEKVTVLNDGNNIYIEFAGNLERLINDSGCDLKEAVDMVMMCNNVSSLDANIIVDESCVDIIDIDKSEFGVESPATTKIYDKQDKIRSTILKFFEFFHFS